MNATRYFYHAGRLETVKLGNVVYNSTGALVQLVSRGGEIVQFTPDSPILRHRTAVEAHRDQLAFLEGEPPTVQRAARIAELRAAIAKAETLR